MKKKTPSQILKVVIATIMAVATLLAPAIISSANDSGAPAISMANLEYGGAMRLAFTLKNVSDYTDVGIAVYEDEHATSLVHVTFDYELSGSMKCYYTQGIAAKDIDKTYYISVVKGSPDSFVSLSGAPFAYSVEKYALANINSSYEKRKTLCEKILGYLDASEGIFGDDAPSGDIEAPSYVIYDAETELQITWADSIDASYAQRIAVAVEAATGKAPTLSDGSSAEAEHQIVIGRTDSAVSMAAYSALNTVSPAEEGSVRFLIYSDGSSVAIAYDEEENDSALKAAIDHFVASYALSELSLAPGVAYVSSASVIVENLIYDSDSVLYVVGADGLDSALAESVKSAIASASGNNATIVGAGSVAGDHEIVIGRTDRAVSALAYAALEEINRSAIDEYRFLIYSDGSSVAIAYDEDDYASAAEAAVAYFADNYALETLVLEPGTAYSASVVLELNAPNLIYYKNSALNVVYADGLDSALAESVKSAIASASGNNAIVVGAGSVAGDHEIVIGRTDRAVSIAAYEALLALDAPEEYYYRFAIYSDGSSVAIVFDEDAYGSGAADAVSYFVENYAVELLTLAPGTAYAGTAMNEVKESDLLSKEEAWDKFAGALNTEDEVLRENIVTAFKDFYTIYDEGLIEWMANLYDPCICVCQDLYGYSECTNMSPICGSAAFYYTTSSRDALGMLPTIEGTNSVLGFIAGSGIMSGNMKSYLGDDVGAKIGAFAYNLQEADGYFYHPNWGHNIGDSRRGRDYDRGIGILDRFGMSPKYTLGSSASAASANNSASKASLLSPMRTSTVSLVSKVVAAATVNSSIPYYLQSVEAFKEYLETTKSNGFYSTGNNLGAQMSQIKARGQAYIDAIGEFLDTYQDENGFFNYTVPASYSYLGVNGIMKVSGVYNSIGRRMPYAEAALERALEAITETAVPSGHVDVWNPWVAVSNALKNMGYEKTSTTLAETDENAVATWRAEILKKMPECIAATKTKISKFRQADGSFSYIYKNGYAYATPTMQGEWCGIENTREGDMDAAVLSVTSMVSSMAGVMGVSSYPRIYGRYEGLIFKDIIDSREAKGDAAVKKCEGHNMSATLLDDWAVINNPSCKADLKIRNHCTDPGCNYVITIEKPDSTVPHSVSVYTPNDNATCFEYGTMNGKCDICGKTVVVTNPDNPPTGKHTYANIATPSALKTPATATEPSVYYMSCEVCGGLSATTFIGWIDYPANDNNWPGITENFGTLPDGEVTSGRYQYIDCEDGNYYTRYERVNSSSGASIFFKPYFNGEAVSNVSKYSYSFNIRWNGTDDFENYRAFLLRICGAKPSSATYKVNWVEPKSTVEFDNGTSTLNYGHYNVQMAVGEWHNVRHEFIVGEEAGTYTALVYIDNVLKGKYSLTECNVLPYIEFYCYTGSGETVNSGACFDIDDYIFYYDVSSCEGAHTYGEYVSDENATCTLLGTQTRICSACGASETVAIEGSKKAHNYGEWSEVIDSATCLIPTQDKRVCVDCGAVEYRDVEGTSTLDHVFVQVVADVYVAATPTASQSQLYYKSCRWCGLKSAETFEYDPLASGEYWPAFSISGYGASDATVEKDDGSDELYLRLDRHAGASGSNFVNFNYGNVVEGATKYVYEFDYRFVGASNVTGTAIRMFSAKLIASGTNDNRGDHVGHNAGDNYTQNPSNFVGSYLDESGNTAYSSHKWGTSSTKAYANTWYSIRVEFTVTAVDETTGQITYSAVLYVDGSAVITNTLKQNMKYPDLAPGLSFVMYGPSLNVQNNTMDIKNYLATVYVNDENIAEVEDCESGAHEFDDEWLTQADGTEYRICQNAGCSFIARRGIGFYNADDESQIGNGIIFTNNSAGNGAFAIVEDAEKGSVYKYTKSEATYSTSLRFIAKEVENAKKVVFEADIKAVRTANGELYFTLQNSSGSAAYNSYIVPGGRYQDFKGVGADTKLASTGTNYGTWFKIRIEYDCSGEEITVTTTINDSNTYRLVSTNVTSAKISADDIVRLHINGSSAFTGDIYFDNVRFYQE